jgi:hypothetical protein
VPKTEEDEVAEGVELTETTAEGAVETTTEIVNE